jgi:carbon-monoxide dehydrogenase medium subunit
MKPPAFTYHRPATVAEALETLADVGTDAKVLAGGQSLVPLLNMRLVAPTHLVDINGLGAELSAIQSTGTGITLGALVRHARVERHADAPVLLREATRHIAHPAIRNRGTTVGSLAHADPASELPAVLLLSDGTVNLASAAGVRSVPASEFFVGPLETSLRPDELAVSAYFGEPPPRSGTAWVEVSRRSGDYALCGLGLVVTFSAERRVERASAAYISVGPAPVLVDLTEAVTDHRADAIDWAAAGELARGRVNPDANIHASVAYRRHLVGVLTKRAGRLATERAGRLATERAGRFATERAGADGPVEHG